MARNLTKVCIISLLWMTTTHGIPYPYEVEQGMHPMISYLENKRDWEPPPRPGPEYDNLIGTESMNHYGSQYGLQKRGASYPTKPPLPAAFDQIWIKYLPLPSPETKSGNDKRMMGRDRMNHLVRYAKRSFGLPKLGHQHLMTAEEALFLEELNRLENRLGEMNAASGRI